LVVQAVGGAAAASAAGKATSASMVGATSGTMRRSLDGDRAGTLCWEESLPNFVRNELLLDFSLDIPFLYPLVAITIYAALAVEFFLRFKYNSPVRYIDTMEKSKRSISKKLQMMLFGLSFCTLLVFIR